MPSYLEIAVTASQVQREMLIPTMVELGCHGFQETDTELLCYVERERWNDSALEHLSHFLRSISANASVVMRDLDDTMWDEQWKSSVQPITIGNRLLVAPTWHPVDTNDRIVIRIDPKMSFGTGFHESTRLCCVLLEEYVTRGARVLDVGTGTGLLAIAAVKFGAVHAIGLDIDEWSIENARESVRINRVEDQTTISQTPLAELEERAFDLIVSNIVLRTNIELLDEFYRKLKQMGMLIVSGLLHHDRDAMRKALEAHAFVIVEERSENEWIAIAARRVR
jgi:ribosomal protein L11 methyltransferase